MAFFRPLNTFDDNTNLYNLLDADSGYNPHYVPIDKLRNSDVFTAMNVIANDIADKPIKLEADNVDHITDSAFSDLNYLLNVQANDHMTARDFKYSLAMNLLATGNGLARIYREPRRHRPVDLGLLLTSWVWPEIDDQTGELRYRIQDGSHDPYYLPAEDVIHVKFLTTNGLMGVSPLYALIDEVQLQKSGNKLLNDFFSSGMNGSAILRVPGDPAPDSRNHIRNEWIKANTGDTHRVIVMSKAEDYTPVEIDTSVLKIVNSNDYTSKQIAKAFGIPVSRLGLENSHTSLPQSNLDYIQNSLDHYFARFTAEFNSKLLSYQQSKKYHFEFDVSRLMELDTETNMKMTLAWYQMGLLDDNESRQRIGYAPHDDAMAGRRVVMSNYVPIENIRENFPNNVIKGNAYDDTGKPINKSSFQETGTSDVLKTKDTEKGDDADGNQKFNSDADLRSKDQKD
jgi:HK97 family phage portal protein